MYIHRIDQCNSCIYTESTILFNVHTQNTNFGKYTHTQNIKNEKCIYTEFKLGFHVYTRIENSFFGFCVRIHSLIPCMRKKCCVCTLNQSPYSVYIHETQMEVSCIYTKFILRFCVYTQNWDFYLMYIHRIVTYT